MALPREQIRSRVLLPLVAELFVRKGMLCPTDVNDSAMDAERNRERTPLREMAKTLARALFEVRSAGGKNQAGSDQHPYNQLHRE